MAEGGRAHPVDGGYTSSHLPVTPGRPAGFGTFPEWLAPMVAPASQGLSLSRSR